MKFLIGLNVNEPDTFLIKFEVLKMISSTLFGVSRSHFHRLLKLEYSFNIQRVYFKTYVNEAKKCKQKFTCSFAAEAKTAKTPARGEVSQ